MSPKLWKKFKTLERRLSEESGKKVDLLLCKICDCPCHKGEWVITKPSKYGGRKIYHDECYEKSFY